MIVGCVKEIKTLENRVAIVPSSVKVLTNLGVGVLVQQGAGLGSSIRDESYAAAGGQIVESAEEVWSKSDIIAKVKEPLTSEFKYFREGQTIFTFLHLAAEEALTHAMLAKKVCGIAYETIEVDGRLPLLTPMSEVAGRMSVQVGAHCLEIERGGKGILLGGVPGVRKARVVILGAGIVGKNAAKIALGMGACVSILDINAARLAEMDDLFHGQVRTIFSNQHSIEEQTARADVLIGAVLLPGARAPVLVSADLIKKMEAGSVVIDVAVDQGGCIETVKRTMLDNPTYLVNGVVHYGVANMPGAVAQTSTYALSHATFPYLLKMAKAGVLGALKESPALRTGLNTFKGFLAQEQVAKALAMPFHNPDTLVQHAS